MLLPYHCHHPKSRPASSSLLDLSSKLLQHHIVQISRVRASQKQALVELENNKHSKQREKVASYSSPTNKNQKHFTPHPHIHHPGIPVQYLGLSCACTPEDPDPPPVSMGSAKSSQILQNTLKLPQITQNYPKTSVYT